VYFIDQRACCSVSGAAAQEATVDEVESSASAGEQDYLDEVLMSMSSDDESAATPPRRTAVSPTSEAERQLLLQAECATSLDPPSPLFPLLPLFVQHHASWFWFGCISVAYRVHSVARPRPPHASFQLHAQIIPVGSSYVILCGDGWIVCCICLLGMHASAY
jgi:hypothetical protein